MIPHGAIVLYAAFVLLSVARIFMNRPGGVSNMATYFSGATVSLLVTGLAAYGMVAMGAAAFEGAMVENAVALVVLIAACIGTWIAMRRIWGWELMLEVHAPSAAGAPPAAPRAGRSDPEPRTPRQPEARKVA